MFSYKVDTSDIMKQINVLGANPKLVEAELLLALNKSSVQIQNMARGQAPVRTGKMRNSINFQIHGLTSIIAPNVKYATFVEGGTGIYGPNHKAITPKKASVLATKINPGWGTANKSGYFIIGKSSKGQKANPFMQRTYVASQIVVLYNFEKARDNIIMAMFANKV